MKLKRNFITAFMGIFIAASIIGCSNNQAVPSGENTEGKGEESNVEVQGSEPEGLIPISFARTTDASVESNIFAQN